MSLSARNLEGSFAVESVLMKSQGKDMISDEIFNLSGSSKKELAAKICNLLEATDLYAINEASDAQDTSEAANNSEITEVSDQKENPEINKDFDNCSISSEVNEKMNSTFDTAKPSCSSDSWASFTSDLDSSATTTETEAGPETVEIIRSSFDGPSSGFESLNGSGQNRAKTPNEVEIFYGGRDLLDLNANLRDMRWNFRVTEVPLEISNDYHIQYKPYRDVVEKELEIGNEDICSDCGLKVSIIYI